MRMRKWAEMVWEVSCESLSSFSLSYRVVGGLLTMCGEQRRGYDSTNSAMVSRNDVLLIRLVPPSTPSLLSCYYLASLGRRL